MHAIAFVFDFVEPLVAFRRRVDQLRQLRPNRLRQCGRVGAPAARYPARNGDCIGGFTGRRMRLLAITDLADMPRGIGELEDVALSQHHTALSNADGRNEIKHLLNLANDTVQKLANTSQNRKRTYVVPCPIARYADRRLSLAGYRLISGSRGR